MTHLLTVTAHPAAAGCVFLLLLNRVVMLSLAAIRQGFTTEGLQSITLPLVVLALVGVGEIFCRPDMFVVRFKGSGPMS
jgi:hypothetical protein